jgi:hypothetical protein
MTRRLRPWIHLACLAGLSFAVAGCGLTSSGNGASAAGGQTPQPTASSGLVTVSVGAASYASKDTVQVTITNGSSAPIYFADHNTSCTVIELQQQAGGSWNTANPCKLAIATREHSLDAGKTLNVSLPPGNGWAAGTYRAALQYWTGAHFSGKTSAAYSAVFQIS